MNNMVLNLKRPLCTFDIETTGLDIISDRIVEISVFKVFPNGDKKMLHYMLNPGIPIPEQATQIHGISNEKVKDKPFFREVAKDVYDFMNDSDLCGFNLHRLDIPILLEEFLREEIVFSLKDRKIIDVQRIFHSMERRDLTAAYKFYCDKELNAHNAIDDSTATFEVLEAQIQRYEEIENDIDFLNNLSNENEYIDTGRRLIELEGKPAFNFGKYKGQFVKDVLEKDPSYYSWIINNNFLLHTKQKLKEIKLSLK